MSEMRVDAIASEVYERMDGIVPLLDGRVRLTMIVATTVAVLADNGFIDLVRPEGSDAEVDSG